MVFDLQEDHLLLRGAKAHLAAVGRRGEERDLRGHPGAPQRAVQRQRLRAQLLN